MPVRSLTSSVFKWPDAQMVNQAIRRWAAKMEQQHPETLQIGYFGSYAKGNWGVGSDLDLIIVVDHSSLPFTQRSVAWDTLELPVPTDVCVYTQAEWDNMKRQAHRFYREVMREAIWVYQRKAVKGK